MKFLKTNGAVFVVLLACLLTFNSAVAQVDPEGYSGDWFKKNKKMTYDGESTFVFFYEDYIDIKKNWKEKRKAYTDTLNTEITEHNEERNDCVYANFFYPYEILFANEFDEEEDSIKYRYVVATQSRKALISAGYNPFGGPSSALVDEYSTYLYDLLEQELMRISVQTYEFNFCAMVDILWYALEKNEAKH